MLLAQLKVPRCLKHTMSSELPGQPVNIYHLSRISPGVVEPEGSEPPSGKAGGTQLPGKTGDTQLPDQTMSSELPGKPVNIYHLPWPLTWSRRTREFRTSFWQNRGHPAA